jgi:hypothetical protein
VAEATSPTGNKPRGGTIIRQANGRWHDGIDTIGCASNREHGCVPTRSSSWEDSIPSKQTKSQDGMSHMQVRRPKALTFPHASGKLREAH